MDANKSAYLREAVMTATPEQLQLMLYDGAIRFAMQGREALVRKDYEQVFEKLSRAQRIVLEMHGGLRFEVNPELCERMAALYMFIYRKLVDGNVHHDLAGVEDALKILRMERETWQLLCDRLARERAGEAATPPAGSGAPKTASPGLADGSALIPQLSIEC